MLPRCRREPCARDDCNHRRPFAKHSVYRPAVRGLIIICFRMNMKNIERYVYIVMSYVPFFESEKKKVFKNWGGPIATNQKSSKWSVIVKRFGNTGPVLFVVDDLALEFRNNFRFVYRVIFFHHHHHSTRSLWLMILVIYSKFKTLLFFNKSTYTRLKFHLRDFLSS